MRSLLLSVFLFLCTLANSQSIKGKCFDKDGEVLDFATVMLFNKVDSSLIKSELTDEIGFFQFQPINSGSYYIQVEHIGFTTFTSSIIDISNLDLDLGNITLTKNEEVLNEVVVKAKKPLIEFQADKTVINTDASVSMAGLNGLEVLRKAPGVTVDNNENITLKGKSGVRIYIDGKPSYINEQELANLLKGLSSSDIEAIEIITNPSARFEAEGNAGIINLRLRKNKNFGTNGSLNLSTGYGKYHKSYAGLNLNNRNNKWNTFGSVGIGNNKSWNDIFLYRKQDGALFDQYQYQVDHDYPLNAKFGVDLFANAKHTFGVLFNANTQYHDNDWNGISSTKISKLSDQNKLDSVLEASNIITSRSINANANINYRFADTLGNEVVIDLDRGYFNSRSLSIQPNVYKNPLDGTVRSRRDFENETPSKINIHTAKIDYNKSLKDVGMTISLGGKYANVATSNTFDLFNVIDGDRYLDRAQSNTFDYTEEVIAAYANVAGKMGKKVNYQLGLRMENTNSLGDLNRDPSQPIMEDDSISRSYTDFFPSGAITYTINDKHSFNLTYSRRLDRPNYKDLNPFEWRLDELTFRKGNPRLTPQYNNNFEFSYLFMQAASISLAYGHSKDVVTDIVERDENVPNKSFINYRNLTEQKNYALSINSPLPIKSWWNGYLSASVYKTFYKANFDEYNFDIATPIATNFYMEHTFSLPKEFSFEISGWFNSTAIWGGTFVTKPQGSLDLGIQKKLFNGQGSIKLAVTDILYTAGWSGFSDAIMDLELDTKGHWESQRINVNFNYRFGNKNVESSRQRKTGLDDEKKRIKD